METARKRQIVGIFDIVCGAFAFFIGSLVVSGLSSVKSPPPSLRASLMAIIVLFAILGILALAGGICALRRKVWWLTLAGSIAASICLLPLGAPATVLTLLSGKTSRATRLLVFAVLAPVWLALPGFLGLVLLGYS